MFFIAFFGIEDKDKHLGTYKDGVCPSCGMATGYEVRKSYRYFHVFFIPLARWNVRYFVRTSCCGRIYELNGALGREFEKNSGTEIRKEDLRSVDGYSPFGHCPSCRAEVPAEFSYCPYCGAKL
ncbi:MAG: zinc ribbon domain-containing protein [Eubacteriales bacterium]